MPRVAPWIAAAVKMIPRIGPAQGAHSNPVATPSTSEDQIDFFLARCRSDSLDPNATNGRVARSESAGKDERQPEQRKQQQGSPPADLVGANRPGSADRGKRSDDREGQRHARKQRKRAAREAAVGPRENKGKHGQDARADDRQHAAEEGKQRDQHCCAIKPVGTSRRARSCNSAGRSASGRLRTHGRDARRIAGKALLSVP